MTILITIAATLAVIYVYVSAIDSDVGRLTRMNKCMDKHHWRTYTNDDQTRTVVCIDCGSSVQIPSEEDIEKEFEL